MRLLAVVFLVLAVIGFAGCGSDPAPVAPKGDAPVTNVTITTPAPVVAPTTAPVAAPVDAPVAAPVTAPATTEGGN